MAAIVRPARKADLEAITHIYTHYVLNTTATFELDPPGVAEMRERFEKISSLRLPYLAAEENDRILGYAYANQYRPRPAYRFTVESSIYLDPQVTGRGLGSLLLEQLVDACERRGARQMIAVIGDRGNTASIRLHARFGFRKAGVLEAVGLKFGRWIDTVLMQRSLATEPPA